MDSPHEHLPPPINELTATVFAPAAALSGGDGQIRVAGMDGLFLSDVRVLTEAVLRFGGLEPHHLARHHLGPGCSRFVAVARAFGDPMADPTIRVDRVRQVVPDGMTETIRISSTAMRPVVAVMTLDLRCDLTPLEVVKEGRAGPDLRPARDPAGGLRWRTGRFRIVASAPAARVLVDPPRLSWRVEIAPGAQSTVEWRLRVRERDPVLAAPAGPVEWARPVVQAGDRRLGRLLRRSLDDLESLRLTDTAAAADSRGRERTFLGAGAPWFLTLFGRDSIWAARMLLPLGTALAEGTLRALARRQGRALDPVSGEAPGKIMHELRREDARIGPGDGHTPATYYGTVDATLLWVSLLAEAWRWGMPETAVLDLLPHLGGALSWLDGYGDPNGDGFVEYLDVTGRGLANQGWKDSGDAIRFHDGTLARPPIALCEVQGYAHRAALDAAELLDAFQDAVPAAGGGHDAQWWRAYAGRLAGRFRECFWVPGPLGSFPALALDGDGRPVDALTSNIGHLLGTGLLDPGEEATVAWLLDAPPLGGAYGVRTMSTMDDAYAPLSYHRGSVWPHDTVIALLGLARVGSHEAAAGLVASLLDAAEAFDYRLPELYGGDARAEVAVPVPHPAACRPQAWAAAAGVAMLSAVVGLDVHVPRGEVRAAPLRGHGLGPVEVHGLRVAGHAVNVAVTADGTARVDGLPAPLRLVPRVPAQDAAGGARRRTGVRR